MKNSVLIRDGESASVGTEPRAANEQMASARPNPDAKVKSGQQRPTPKHFNRFIDFWLGQQLREIRKSKGLSLQEVAGRCGISVGTLSQVERGITSASVKTLSMLGTVLDVSVNSLFSNLEKKDEEANGWIARAKDHRAMLMKDHKIVKEIISPEKCGALDLYRVRIRPGGSTGNDLFVTDGGDVAGTVISGQLELWIESRLVLLEEGDSFCYPSNAPRKWSNPGKVETYVIWAITRV